MTTDQKTKRIDAAKQLLRENGFTVFHQAHVHKLEAGCILRGMIVPATVEAARSTLSRRLGLQAFEKVKWEDAETADGRELRCELVVVHRGD